jgi:small multidrug resistance family-3 protein
MLTTLQRIPVPLLLVLATTLEVSGDALVRLGIYQHAGLVRFICFLGAAVLLFGYASFLNIAPVEFARIVGLYIATLFVIWQVISFLVFKTPPALPIILGGLLIISGGLIITFWRAPA